MNELKVYSDPIRTLPHGGNAKHCFTRCSRCTLSLSLSWNHPLIFENIDFHTCVFLCFCDAFSMDAIERSPIAMSYRRGLEHSSLHSARTTRALDVVPRGYSRLHLFYLFLKNCTGGMSL